MSNYGIIDGINKKELLVFDRLSKEGFIKFDESREMFFTYTKTGINSNLSVKELVKASTTEFMEREYHKNVIHDELGDPLVVRHGTHLSFNSFTHNPKGIYFANFSEAITYAKNRLEQTNGGYIGQSHGIHLVQCFIGAKNIKYLNRQKYRDIDTSQIREQGYDCIVAYNTRDSAGIYHQYIIKDPSQIYILQIA